VLWENASFSSTTSVLTASCLFVKSTINVQSTNAKIVNELLDYNQKQQHLRVELVKVNLKPLFHYFNKLFHFKQEKRHMTMILCRKALTIQEEAMMWILTAV